MTNHASTKERSQIVVIGAGFAGLTAAYRLYQQGYKNIEIYEARERVGGRVLSVRIMGLQGESIVELGGQNIPDGGEAPRLRALISEFGFSLLEDEIEIKQVFFDKKTKSYIDILKLQGELFPSEDRVRLKSKIQSLAAQSKNMEEILLALFPDKGILYRSLVFKFAAYEGGIPSQVSTDAWENLYYMLCGGLAAVHGTNMIKRARIQEGNASLALELAKKLKGLIHLSQPLKALKLTTSNRILLTFEGGVQKECDKVILTMPCSVYKDIEIDFHLIPTKRLSFFHKVPYGDNTKIMLPVKFNTLSPNSVMVDEMSAFFSQESDMCTLYFSGEAGRTLKDHIKEQYAHALAVLKVIYSDIIYSATLPQVANDKTQLNTYNGPVTHFWVDDPYAQGSYSYRSPDITPELNGIEDYKGERVRIPYSPLNNRIFFGGEHTSLHADLGTLEGAVESGERAARMVLASDLD